MIPQPLSTALPISFEDFLQCEPVDGFKYEWYDGDLIRFKKLNKKHFPIIRVLNRLFSSTEAHKNGGVFLKEQDVMLSGIQMRRPDLHILVDHK